MVRVSSVLNILASVVGIIGYLPVAAHLDLLPRLAFPVALCAGILFDRTGRHPLAGAPSTLASLGGFLFYGAQLSMANPAAPVVNFLVILLAVRMVNTKNSRNLLQVYALSLFCLASSSLFSLSAVFLVYLLLLLAIIAVSLVLLTFHGVDERLSLPPASLRKVLTAALVMPAASFPLLLVFFALLPRSQYPLLNFLNAPAERTTGFSDRVEPGRAASVGEVKSVAFRVQCEKLAKGELYWRGIVLDTISGTTWLRSGHRAAERSFTGKGRTVRQVVYPEPSLNTYLLALNVPLRLDGVRADQDADFTFTRRGGAGRGRIRYEAVSVLTDTTGVRGEIDREFYLRLPARVSPRTAALARRLTEGGHTDEEMIARVTAWFEGERFAYATKGLPLSEDPVDAFLFERRTGHCEFFASSFAVILRLAGVPTRLVGGYYGGEYNDFGGYYTVTEDMAHVWVEAFVAGKGWIKIDPSALAADFVRVGTPAERSAARRIAAVFDSFSYYWNQAVITYDLQKQVELVRRANNRFRSLDLTPNIQRLVGIALFCLALGGVVFFVRRFAGRSREQRLVERLLTKVGVANGVGSKGLHEIAAAVDDPAVTEFVTVYGRAVYRDLPLTDEEYHRLVTLLGEIGPRKRGGRDG